MSMARSRRTALPMAGGAALLVALGARDAAAFDLKHTPSGQPLRWAGSSVTYVVDPSVEAAVPGGQAAVSRALASWSETGGGPALVAKTGPGGAQPGVDGQNSVLLAPAGFAPAGKALAVTVTSFDDATGAIVDADIVLNGTYAFAVLAAGAVSPSDATPVATDGSARASDDEGAVFDLVHVASHEVGHSLGLADVRDDPAALMYAFTMPGDASVRQPSADDVDGVDTLYGAAAAGPASGVAASTGTGHAGCGQASVAGTRPHPGDAWAALALFGGAGLWLSARRGRARAVRAALPVSAALFALLAGPGPARSAEAPLPASASASASARAKAEAPAQADAAARVVSVGTRNVGGLFETTIEVEPTECRLAAATGCPARATARVWGGSLGGITQRVGEDVVPAVGDAVEVNYLTTAAAPQA
ncbi:MAG: matrixin family metalloprotease, partial [Myxococcales bacterium]|nr:matrixin family metalloprotease [Myxococcales bacterium]